MSTISLRLSDEEEKLFREYANLQNITLSSLIRDSVIEKIEDQYDLDLFNKAYAESKTYHFLDDVKRELDL